MVQLPKKWLSKGPWFFRHFGGNSKKNTTTFQTVTVPENKPPQQLGNSMCSRGVVVCYSRGDSRWLHASWLNVTLHQRNIWQWLGGLPGWNGDLMVMIPLGSAVFFWKSSNGWTSWKVGPYWVINWVELRLPVYEAIYRGPISPHLQLDPGPHLVEFMATKMIFGKAEPQIYLETVQILPRLTCVQLKKLKTMEKLKWWILIFGFFQKHLWLFYCCTCYC